MLFIYGTIFGAAVAGILSMVFTSKLDALHAKINEVLTAVKAK